ncbi:radical SAM protein, partial [Campylobacter jejuni]
QFWNAEKINSLRALHKTGRFYENPICSKCISGALLV